jgi:hypothetical protein
MKEKLSGLSGAWIGIVIIIAALIGAAGSSVPTTGAATILRAQGAGRPTPKPTPTRRTKHQPTRTRPATSGSTANNVNRATPNRNAVAKGNANNRTRSRRTTSAINANNGNNAASQPVAGANAAINANISDSPSTPGGINLNSSEGIKTLVRPDFERFITAAPRPTPTANPDADILLPNDFKELESQVYFTSDSSPLFGDPLGRRLEPRKPLNTTGAFSEIANKRKVYVNNQGEYGEKITTRLRAYGGLEIVKTAGEAELAVWYDTWAFDKRTPDPVAPTILPETVRTVTGGTLFITIRDSATKLPRIIWRHDDTDGGWFKRGDAVDKLAKRFVNELKKLRGEK